MTGNNQSPVAQTCERRLDSVARLWSTELNPACVDTRGIYKLFQCMPVIRLNLLDSNNRLHLSKSRPSSFSILMLLSMSIQSL